MSYDPFLFQVSSISSLSVGLAPPDTTQVMHLMADAKNMWSQLRFEERAEDVKKVLERIAQGMLGIDILFAFELFKLASSNAALAPGGGVADLDAYSPDKAWQSLSGMADELQGSEVYGTILVNDDDFDKASGECVAAFLNSVGMFGQLLGKGRSLDCGHISTSRIPLFGAPGLWGIYGHLPCRHVAMSPPTPP